MTQISYTHFAPKTRYFCKNLEAYSKVFRKMMLFLSCDYKITNLVDGDSFFKEYTKVHALKGNIYAEKIVSELMLP